MTATPQPDIQTDTPPRRAQIHMPELELKKMLGLGPDDSLRGIVYDVAMGSAVFVVESPHLPPVGIDWKEGFEPRHDTEPPYVKLPLADSYEQRS